MSRCFPFPPPGYGARGDALFEFIKLLQKEKKKHSSTERDRSSKQSSHDDGGSAYKIRRHPLKKQRKQKELKSKSELLVASSDIIDSLVKLTLSKKSSPQPSYEVDSALKIPRRSRKHGKHGELKLKRKLQFQVASSGIADSLANLTLWK